MTLGKQKNQMRGKGQEPTCPFLPSAIPVAAGRAQNTGRCNMGKRTKEQKAEAKVYEKFMETGKQEYQDKVDAIRTRAALMAEAQKKGIKYFRILNKEQLTKVLAEETTDQQREVIIAMAKDAWKAGWGNRKQVAA